MSEATTEDRLALYDRELEELRRRMERVEGELGIVDLDPAGIPNKGERRPATQQEN